MNVGEEEKKRKVKFFGLLCFLGREQECFSSLASPVLREVTGATGGVIVRCSWDEVEGDACNGARRSLDRHCSAEQTGWPWSRAMLITSLLALSCRFNTGNTRVVFADAMLL
jgi:hypothetical protein